MNKFIKITKKEEWELLSKNKFQKIHSYVKEDSNREELFNAIIVGFNFDECYDDKGEERVLIKNRSNDYIDNNGCYYDKKGQAYKLETQKTIVVLKDYGFSLSFRIIKKIGGK